MCYIKAALRTVPMTAKLKGKISLCLTKHDAMKTYWGSGAIAPAISILVSVPILLFVRLIIPVKFI